MRAVRLIALLVLVPVVSLPTAAHGASPADRDGDKVFDELEGGRDNLARRPVLVALRATATQARVRAIEEDVGDLGTVTRLQVVHAFGASATAEQVRALAQRADVAHVEENSKAVPFGVTAHASFGLTRAREDVPGLDGEGLVAAVIDSGIDTTMPDLPPSKVVAFKDFVKNATEPYDDLGHGSLVSGLLAGTGAGGVEGRGAAPAAKLVVVKVIDENAQSSMAKIAEGIDWVVAHRAQYGIDVINLSIGDPTQCGSTDEVAAQAVDAAVAAGLVVVAATGNFGPDPCTVRSPASARSALSVGAMADLGAGGFSLAWFSSRGPTLDGVSKPDVVAPGVDVSMAAPPGIPSVQSGTSAAAPFVAGAALLMLQANPALTPAQVKDAMERTAIDWGAPGRDNAYGAGRLDVYAALRAAGAPLATPPAVPGHVAWSGTLAKGESHTRPISVTGDRFPLAVTMNGPAAGFDVTLLGEGGNPVGTMRPQFFGPSRHEDWTVSAPSRGPYTVRVTANDGAGDFQVDVSGALDPSDATGPALTLDAVAPGAVLSLGGAAGTAEGDFQGVVARVRRDGDVVRRLAATPAGGHWTAAVDPPLPDGDYTVEAEQGDSAGNVTRVPARAFTVDTTAPVVTISGMTFSASEAAEFTCSVNDGPFEPCTKLGPYPDGEYRVVVRARDAAGNVGSASTVFKVDTTAPVVTISDRLQVASSEGSLECRVDGGAWGPCGTLPAGAGMHVLEARATDAAGNVSAVVRREWTVDAVFDPPLTLPVFTPPAPVAAPTPVIALSVPKQRLATVLKKGLTVRVTCDCKPTLVLKRGRKIIARGTGRTLKLTAAGRKSLARAKRVTLTLTVTAPGAKPVTRRVKLAR